jgi:hypothetical protein
LTLGAEGKRGRRKFGTGRPKTRILGPICKPAINMFINQKLKTVYNPLRNYKQDPMDLRKLGNFNERDLLSTEVC